MNPKDAMPYHTLGAVYEEVFESKKALKWYKKSIEVDNSFFMSKYNLYLHYAHIGKFEQAWQFFEHRFQLSDLEIMAKLYHKNKNKSYKRLSNVNEIKGFVTILSEAGIGDFILYSRFFRDLIKATDNITALIDKKLKQYMSVLFRY